MVGERLAAHRFECRDEGYPGWLWEVSLARASRSRSVTVCEIHLIPGSTALLAPPWIPWRGMNQDLLVPISAHAPATNVWTRFDRRRGAEQFLMAQMEYGRACRFRMILLRIAGTDRRAVPFRE